MPFFNYLLFLVLIINSLQIILEFYKNHFIINKSLLSLQRSVEKDKDLNVRNFTFKSKNLKNTIWSHTFCQKAGVVNLLKDNIENPNKRNVSLIKIISNLYTLKIAYIIYLNKSFVLINDIKDDVFDEKVENFLANLSKKLQNGKYLFSKLKGSLNSNRSDLIVIYCIQLVLEAIYKFNLKKNFHGYRENTNMITALNAVDQTFRNVPWVIQGSVMGGFSLHSNEVLFELLKRRIHCDKTLSLIRKGFKTSNLKIGGNKEKNLFQWTQEKTLNSLLTNIYLTEFDNFIEMLKTDFDKGKIRKKSKVYRQIQYNIEKTGWNKNLIIKIWKVNSKDIFDKDFRRLVYIRFEEDFLIGVIGSYADSVKIQDKVINFLENDLKLLIFRENFQIIHFTKTPITFLNTSIHSSHGSQKLVTLIKKNDQVIRTRVTPRLTFKAPIKEILKELQKIGIFFTHNTTSQPTSIGWLTIQPHSTILHYYNSKIYSILNRYYYASNRKSLGTIIHLIKRSCALTLALKYKLKTEAKAFKKFGLRLMDKTTGVKLYLPKTFKKLVFSIYKTKKIL